MSNLQIHVRFLRHRHLYLRSIFYFFSNSQIGIQWRHWCMLQITSNLLGQVLEAIMEKRQDQIPDEGFLMTKKREGKKSKQMAKYRNSLCGYSVHCSKEY